MKEIRCAINHSENIVFVCLNRYVWIYEDGLRVLYLGNDSGADLKGQHVIEVQFPKNLSWQRPYNREVIDEERMATIKAHIRDALAVLEPNSLVEFYEEPA